MSVCPLCTAKTIKGVVLAIGKVRNMALGSYPSSRDCMKRNKSKSGDKLKMADHTGTTSCFVVDAQPLIYSKLY